MRILIGQTVIGGRPAALYVLPQDRDSSVRIGDPSLTYVVPGEQLSGYVEALQRMCRQGGLLP